MTDTDIIQLARKVAREESIFILQTQGFDIKPTAEDKPIELKTSHWRGL